LTQASAIIALSKDEQNEYLFSRPQDISKVSIVPSIRPLVKIPERGLFRSEWGIKAQDFIILYLGRLHSGKGIQYIIQALQLLEDDRLRLVIVGPDTGQERILRKLVEDTGLQRRVLFVGPIYGDKKFSAFRDADIFVLPSQFEQLPISALEAALCELPLVLSNRCGMTKMVLEANAGLIVPYGSSQALAEVVKNLYEKPNLRKQMGQNAKVMVENHGNPDNVIYKLEAVYKKVLR
jgi:glycosyltransferase involved in cell wall biosynthesis